MPFYLFRSKFIPIVSYLVLFQRSAYLLWLAWNITFYFESITFVEDILFQPVTVRSWEASYRFSHVVPLFFCFHLSLSVFLSPIIFMGIRLSNFSSLSISDCLKVIHFAEYNTSDWATASVVTVTYRFRILVFLS